MLRRPSSGDTAYGTCNVCWAEANLPAIPDELAALRVRVAALEEALRYYAKPRAYGSGTHSVFIDDCAVAREAL